MNVQKDMFILTPRDIERLLVYWKTDLKVPTIIVGFES